MIKKWKYQNFLMNFMPAIHGLTVYIKYLRESVIKRDG